MDTLFNIAGIRILMDDVPKGQRIHNCFNGAKNQLSNEQIDNIVEIIKNHTSDISSFLISLKEKEN